MQAHFSGKLSSLKDKNLVSYAKPGGFGGTLNSSVRSCEGAAVNGCREGEVLAYLFTQDNAELMPSHAYFVW